MARACDVCGADFDARRPSARYCSSSCRGKASRLRKRGIEVGRNQVITSGPNATRSELAEAVHQQLLDAGLLGTYGAQTAMLLAERLGQPQTLDTGSAISALSRELDRVMTGLLADVQTQPDAIDQAQALVIHLDTRRRRTSSAKEI